MDLDSELPDEHTTQSKDETYHQIMEETIQGLTELSESKKYIVYPHAKFAHSRSRNSRNSSHARGIPIRNVCTQKISRYTCVSGAPPSNK